MNFRWLRWRPVDLTKTIFDKNDMTKVFYVGVLYGALFVGVIWAWVT